jgi:hypothetical protein
LARFLAVREALTGDAPSQSAIEQMLIDQAAQTHTLLLSWQEELMGGTALANRGSRDDKHKEQIRLDDAKAIEQAMAMLERLQAMCLRSVKALQDMQREWPRVVVRRAGQVNVGQQQVNLNAAKG